MAKLPSYPGKEVQKVLDTLPPSFLNILKTKDIYIFGGFIRDIVAGFPFHDIDMITLPLTMKYIDKLQNHVGLDNLSFHEHGGKALKSDKTFHLWRGNLRGAVKGIPGLPVDFICSPMSPTEKPKNVVVWAVQQVDLRCCGLLYDYPTGRIIELVPGAYQDAKDHIVRIVPYAGMYDEERTGARIKKLCARGWKVTR